jgi:glycosyltransferase Alg8
MWTPLVGPITAVCFTIIASPAFLYAYLVWVMLTRLLQALALLTVRPTIDGLYPVLVYYNQVYGAFLKTYALFRLDRQRWTRQNIRTRSTLPPWRAALRAAGSLYLHALALCALATAVAVSTGLLPVPARLAALAASF